MKVKTAELTGAALNWVVASIEWPNDTGILNPELVDKQSVDEEYPFDKDWSLVGSIIEREKIGVTNGSPLDIGFSWFAHYPAKGPETIQMGDSPLVAIVRCFIASKLGDEVEVPDHLL